MRFSIRFADKIVGALVILALAILVIVVFMLGRNQRWFKQDIQYKTYYTSATGLSPNMPVYYMGFTIGNVKKINLVIDNTANINYRVEVLFSIFMEYKQMVKEGSIVEILVSPIPIGLGSSFNFYSGKGKELLPEGTVIPEYSADPLAKQYVANGLVDRPDTAGDSIGNIIFQVNDVIAKINNAVTGSQPEGYTMVEQIMIDITQVIKKTETLMQNLSGQLYPIMDNLDTFTGRISDPSGAVMSILDTEGSVYTSISTSLDSISGILDNLEKTSDFFPSNLPGLLIDLNTALRKVQDVATAISNFPLFRGGIPERREASPGGTGSRNQEF
jgi:phospholipid/cholesterol/gamma-HCH transport system substrate-binding protein